MMVVKDGGLMMEGFAVMDSMDARLNAGDVLISDNFKYRVGLTSPTSDRDICWLGFFCHDMLES